MIVLKLKLTPLKPKSLNHLIKVPISNAWLQNIFKDMLGDDTITESFLNKFILIHLYTDVLWDSLEPVKLPLSKKLLTFNS